ncbi:hypothetical protein B4N84_01795, partial [Flavobacterium sp. IR1]
MKPLSILLLLVGFSAFSQENQITPIENVEELKKMAFENNLGLEASSLRVDEADARIGSAFTFDKTEGYFGNDESNRAGDQSLDVLGVRQFFNFPTVYFARKKVYKTSFRQEQSTFQLKKLNLEQKVSRVYYQLQY